MRSAKIGAFSSFVANPSRLQLERCVFSHISSCLTFIPHLSVRRRSFDSRELLSLPNGGDYTELVKIFQTNRFPRLSALTLFMSPQLPSQAMSSVMQYALPTYSTRITKFVTNYPWVSEVAEMKCLQSLTFDLSDVGASHKLQSYGGYSIGSYPSLREARRPRTIHDKFSSRRMGSDPWILPTSGSLVELIILTDYITLPDEIRINLDSEKCLANLKYLKLRVPFKRLTTADFHRLCPKLEILDLDLESDCGHIKVPPTITKLIFALRRSSQAAFPFSASDLPNLTDLTIRHAEPHFPRMWWSADQRTPKTSELVVEPLLCMNRLNRLTILSSEFINRTSAYMDLFQQMVSAPDKPILESLDVFLGRFPASFMTLVRSSFPAAEIRFTHGVIQSNEGIATGNGRREEPCRDSSSSESFESDETSDSEEDRGFVKCRFCSTRVGELNLEDHWEICAEAPKKCPLSCPFSGNRRQMRLHLLECPFYDVKCFECDRIVTRAHWTSHIQHHERLSTKLPPELLRSPLRQTPEWLETKCHACRQTFPTLRATQAHSCCQVGRRVPLPNQRSILNNPSTPLGRRDGVHAIRRGVP